MKKGSPKIALIGAGGATFGTLMIYEALRAEKLHGAELALIDINPMRLEVTRAAGERMNESMGGPLKFTTYDNTAKGVEDADFIIISVEVDRWRYWKQDLEIPVKHGSKQDMGENGGPGGLFHALRTIPLVLKICREIESSNTDALVINVTNPLPRVNMALHKATKLRLAGDCPEYRLALPRMSMKLMLPIPKIRMGARGLNHFTWIYELENTDTGEDMYPRLKTHTDFLPALHGKLGLRCFKEFGEYPVSSDSHIGEYLPSDGPGSRSVLPRWFPYQQFSEFECSWRVRLSTWYGQGKFELPFKSLPRAVEGTMELIEAMASGSDLHVNAVNVLNDGYISNLPDWAVVEVPAEVYGGKLMPCSVPAVTEPLATIMNEQCKIQSLIADSVLQNDPELAFQALCMDPLAPPSERACRAAFDEVLRLQKDVMPFK